jgi:hypothetical protein
MQTISLLKTEIKISSRADFTKKNDRIHSAEMYFKKSQKMCWFVCDNKRLYYNII